MHSGMPFRLCCGKTEIGLWLCFRLGGGNGVWQIGVFACYDPEIDQANYDGCDDCEECRYFGDVAKSFFRKCEHGCKDGHGEANACEGAHTEDLFPAGI